MAELGIYIHIPFCVRKCDYCDFESYADKFQFVHQYIDALEREFTWYRDQRRLSGYTPITVYIGGGTPSLLTEQILQFLTANHRPLRWETLKEKTIEVNPGAVTADQLHALHAAGFNRLSIGVQSFHDNELQMLGRIHSHSQALECFRQAREAGFQNISIDLMFGVPTSTLKSWKQSLQQAIALEPEHIAVYNLTIEPGTPFGHQYRQGLLSLPGDQLQIAMYETAIQSLENADYEQYEISNFARPNCRSVHNQIYWRN
jgi:oxygen-independent coproporphyrinogen-3 oxidase